MHLIELYESVKKQNMKCNLYKDLSLIDDIYLYKNITLKQLDIDNVINDYDNAFCPPITCAILTYNEEKNIYKCISSIYNEFDEILVLDSFSTDNTIKIIEKNFPNVKVYFKAWIDDFSSHRNDLINKCNTNWIYFIDSDNYYNDEPYKFKRSIKLLDFIGFNGVASPKIQEFNNHIYTDNRKLFNINSNLKFYGKIHEEPLINNCIVPNNITLDLLIYHSGYDPNIIDMNKKTLRNINLTREMLKLEPDNPKWLYFYCREMYLLEKISYKEILNLLKKAIQLYESSDYDRYFIETLNLICNICIKNGDFFTLKHNLKYFEKNFPFCVDIDYYKALMIYTDLQQKMLLILDGLDNLDRRKPSFINSQLLHIDNLKLELAWKLNNSSKFTEIFKNIRCEETKLNIKKYLNDAIKNLEIV